MFVATTLKKSFFFRQRKLVVPLLLTLAAFFQLSLAPSSLAASTHTFRYSVEYGDSLAGIASRNHVAPDSIRFLNTTPGPYPFPGTQLVLSVPNPPRAPNARTLGTLCAHQVQYGETIFSIARRYGIDPYYLARINWLYDADYIYAGQILRVPCRPAPPPQNCGTSVRYRVVPGDNLFRIALRYQTTIYSIAIANRIPNPNFIRSGDNLIIPCPGRVATSNLVAPPSPTVLVQAPPNPTATTAVPTTVVQVVVSPTATTAVPTIPALPLATVPLPTSTRAPAPTATPTLNPLLFATAVPASERITMKNTLFQPASLQVKSGTLVVWDNAETTNTPHFIVSGSCDNNICTPTNQFASDILSPGQSFSLRFTYVGTYSYYCVLHGARMTGVITVTP